MESEKELSTQEIFTNSINAYYSATGRYPTVLGITKPDFVRLYNEMQKINAVCSTDPVLQYLANPPAEVVWDCQVKDGLPLAQFMHANLMPAYINFVA